MRKNIERIIHALIAHAAAGDKTCSTDGETIHSYSLLIARRLPSGKVWVAPLRSSTATTNGQIRAVRDSLGSLVVDDVTCTKHDDCRAHPELAEACFRGETLTRKVSDAERARYMRENV